LFRGGGGGVSTFLREEPEMVLFMGFPDAKNWESDPVSVVDESNVDFRETGLEVERESEGVEEGVVYGFGADAKFLKDGSDIRGAFQGNRRITIQL
jgi:hypothetical protein